MGLPKQRLKNVRSTGIKLSKVKAMKFKRMKAPTTIDMRNVQEHVEGMASLSALIYPTIT